MCYGITIKIEKMAKKDKIIQKIVIKRNKIEKKKKM